MIFSSNKTKKQNEELKTTLKSFEHKLDLATTCLEKISAGDFEFNLSTADNANEDMSFINMLSSVRSKMLEYAQRDQQRLWAAEGLSQFMNLTSGNNRENLAFYDNIIALLVKYTGANQGGIFTYNNADPSDPFLELSACYAYGKKKFVERRVDIGNGLLGQCFLEKETTIYTDLPKNYASITSGLGESTPRFLLMVPMKYSNEVLGVIEIASFKKLEQHKVEFVEKVAESLASVSLTIRSSKKVESLFQESQQKAQQLQEKEETLRQNLEELVATQEEMQRNQNELNRQADLLKFILDSIPFPIFVKDELGRYSIVNKAEAKLFNLDFKSLIGKDDSHFVKNKEEWEVIKQSDARVLASDDPVELPLQNFTTTGGKSFIFKTTKIPFLNNVTGKKNILGVSIDLTEKLNLEKKLFKEKKISINNTLINIAGRQRMLTQKIGFYTETLVRGKKQYAGMLRDAIEWYEHSHQVIRYGGMPLGIHSESPLPPLQEELVDYSEKIDKVWQLYKTAAENVLYFSSLEGHFKKDSHNDDVERNISIIETNAESLLKLNNDLMMACIELNQASMVEIN